MAHLEVNTFVSKFISSIAPYYNQSRVLEIGSYDVNGSVRSNFKSVKEYIGVDLIPGPSVDVVMRGHQYRSDSKFDIVLSIESFEHNSDWLETFKNMERLACDDGLVIFTCATKGRPEHGTYRTDPISSPGTSSESNSYYMNLTRNDFSKSFDLDSLFMAYGFYLNKVTRDLYFYGLKSEAKLDAKSVDKFFIESCLCASIIRKKSSWMSYLKVKVFYLLLSPLYTTLSDKYYQNITYPIYKRIRSSIKSLS